MRARSKNIQKLILVQEPQSDLLQALDLIVGSIYGAHSTGKDPRKRSKVELEKYLASKLGVPSLKASKIATKNVEISVVSWVTIQDTSSSIPLNSQTQKKRPGRGERQSPFHIIPIRVSVTLWFIIYLAVKRLLLGTAWTCVSVESLSRFEGPILDWGESLGLIAFSSISAGALNGGLVQPALHNPSAVDRLRKS